MTLLIELTPEVEAAVRKQAAEKGEEIEQFVGSLVARSMGEASTPASTSLEEFERDWDAILEPIKGLPERTHYNYTREDIYFDHD